MDGAFLDVHLGAALPHCNLAPVVQQFFRVWVIVAEKEQEHVVRVGEDGRLRVLRLELSKRAQLAETVEDHAKGVALSDTFGTVNHLSLSAGGVRHVSDRLRIPGAKRAFQPAQRVVSGKLVEA